MNFNEQNSKIVKHINTFKISHEENHPTPQKMRRGITRVGRQACKSLDKLHRHLNNNENINNSNLLGVTYFQPHEQFIDEIKTLIDRIKLLEIELQRVKSQKIEVALKLQQKQANIKNVENKIIESRYETTNQNIEEIIRQNIWMCEQLREREKENQQLRAEITKQNRIIQDFLLLSKMNSQQLQLQHPFLQKKQSFFEKQMQTNEDDTAIKNLYLINVLNLKIHEKRQQWLIPQNEVQQKKNKRIELAYSEINLEMLKKLDQLEIELNKRSELIRDGYQLRCDLETKNIILQRQLGQKIKQFEMQKKQMKRLEQRYYELEKKLCNFDESLNLKNEENKLLETELNNLIQMSQNKINLSEYKSKVESYEIQIETYRKEIQTLILGINQRERAITQKQENYMRQQANIQFFKCKIVQLELIISNLENSLKEKDTFILQIKQNYDALYSKYSKYKHMAKIISQS